MTYARFGAKNLSTKKSLPVQMEFKNNDLTAKPNLCKRCSAFVFEGA